MEIILHFNFTIHHIKTETPLTSLLKDGQIKISQTSLRFQKTVLALLSGLFQSQKPIGWIFGVQWSSSLFTYTAWKFIWGHCEDLFHIRNPCWPLWFLDHYVSSENLPVGGNFKSWGRLPITWIQWMAFFCCFFSKKMEIGLPVLYNQFNCWVEMSPQ